MESERLGDDENRRKYAKGLKFEVSDQLLAMGRERRAIENANNNGAAEYRARRK